MTRVTDHSGYCFLKNVSRGSEVPYEFLLVGGEVVKRKILLLVLFVATLIMTGCIRTEPIKLEIVDQQLTEGDELVLNLVGFVKEDSLGNPSFSIASGPGKIDGGSYVLSTLPGDCNNSPYTVRINAIDGKKRGTAQFKVNVLSLPHGKKVEIEFTGDSSDEMMENIESFLKRNPNDKQGHAVRGVMRAVPEILNLVDMYNSNLELIEIPRLSNTGKKLVFQNLLSESGSVTDFIRDTAINLRAGLLNLKVRTVLAFRNTERAFETAQFSLANIGKSLYEIAGEIADIQNLIEAQANRIQEIWDDLLVLDDEMNILIKFFPNAFDWDRDGIIESDSELRIRVVSRDTDREYIESFRLYTDLIYGGMTYKGNSLVSATVDPEGGDAVFDFDFWSKVAQGEYPENFLFVFDDNDYLIIDEGEVAILRILVGGMLAEYRALTIYNLEPSEELIDLIESVFGGQQPPNLDFIDSNGDGDIVASEVKAFVGQSFLTFRNPVKSPAWLRSIRDIAMELPNSMMMLADDLLNDTYDNTSEHNLTSQWFIPFDQVEYDYMVESIESIEDTLEYIASSGKELDTEIVVGEQGETILLRLYNIFDHPERFSDLLGFLPRLVNYKNLESIVFPDPTFGGVVVNLPKSIP